MVPYPESFMKKLQDYSYRTVVVPSSGIKSDLAHAYNHWQRTRGEGSKIWPLPKILTFDDHIVQIWNRARNETQLREYRLLDTHEFRYLWMKAGLNACKNLPSGKSNESGEAGKTSDDDWITRYVSDICDESIRIWQVMNDYDICLENSGNGGSDDSLQSRYAAWIDEYKRMAEEKKLISRAEIARHLRVKFERSEAKRLFAKYERNTLFVTLPSRKRDHQSDSLDQYHQYIEAATEYGRNVERIELKPACRTRKVFDDTNQEIQAAAAWTRKILEQHLKDQERRQKDSDGCTDSHPPRIGVLVPNLDYRRRNAMERQFLATFCPDGYRVWETPLFKVGAPTSIAQTPVGADALSYLRIRHAGQIKFSEAQALTRSRLVPEDDLPDLRKLTKTDQDIDSILDLPCKDESKESRALADWMAEFSGLLKESRALADWMAEFSGLLKECSDRLDCHWKEDFSSFIEQTINDLGEQNLDDLGLSRPRPSPADLSPADLIDVCRKFNESAPPEDENHTEPQEVSHTIQLSRLEESVTRCEERRELDRLREKADYLKDYLKECAKAYESGSATVKFNEAYEYFLSACIHEPATRHPASCPVEIFPFDQAVGRHFTHLWIMGMRDTDWPPRVHAIPFVDLHILRKKAPDLFERDKSTERAEKELQEIISLCENSSEVVCSFAKRDSGKDREYLGAGSMFGAGSMLEQESMMEQEEPDAHHADPEAFKTMADGAKIGNLTIDWDRCEGRQHDKTAFHPFYDNAEIDDLRKGCTEQFDGHNDKLDLSCGKEAGTDIPELQGDEFATYFECPFKAFAVHRLRVERPPRRFGSSFVAEKSDQAEKIINILDSGKLDKQNVDLNKLDEEMDSETPKFFKALRCPIKDSYKRVADGIYWLEIWAKIPGNEDTQEITILADLLVGMHGRCDTKNVEFRERNRSQQADNAFQLQGIEKKSYEKFLERKRLYPLKVLDLAMKCKDESIVPAYLTGQDLHSGKLFLWAPKLPVLPSWNEEDKTKLKELIRDMKKGFGEGILAPDPIDKRSDRIPEVCRDCHVRTACRHHYID